MSIQRYDTADGPRYRVRWRDDAGHMRSRTVFSKKDATALDAELKAAKYRGEVVPRPGRQTLANAFDDWWRLRGSMLAPSTQQSYLAVWNAHVRGRFDHHRLASLSADPQLFEELTADMRARAVGPASQRRVLMVISAVLTAAVEWKKIATNPITHVPKPPATRKRHPRPFPPIVVEQIRHEMLHRATTDPTGIRPLGDALLVTLMSYAGLRPGEALALTFGDIGKRTIAVDKAIADGEERQTKTGRVRTVPLVSQLGEDVLEYREARRSPPDDSLLFPSGTGRHWSRPVFSNWRARVWKPAVRRLAATDPALGWLARARPYDCRGTFVSLQLRADASPLEVAAWAGHSPQVMFSHYAAVIQEMVGEPALSAEEQIARARDAVECRHEHEVIELMVDLVERPTVAAAEEGGAAELLYAPK